MCKYHCLGIICCPIFIVAVIDELIRCRTRCTEDLNPSVQTSEQPRAVPSMETMPVDSVLESLGAWSLRRS